jgi:hypothetical protein
MSMDMSQNGAARVACPVAFYLPGRQALAGIDPFTLDPERDWQVFGTGVYVWILQTFTQLRRFAAPVQLVERPPEAGIVVTHADDLNRLLTDAPFPEDLVIVVARSDRGPQPLADFSIVQNPADADDDYQFFIPSWLQPGLVPRRLDRGSTIETVAYFGSFRELDPELTAAAWVDALRARGLAWESRTIMFGGGDQLYEQHGWNDYATIDVVVALRPPEAWAARSKPAAKLQNAWAAGVPAILSPESQYRYLRRSALDYIEARSAADVLSAIDRLRAEPNLYHDMVRNGLERGREFQSDRLVQRWVEVLWDEIPQRAARLSHRIFAGSRRWRAFARRLQTRLSAASSRRILNEIQGSA